jgi:hypothetical protein
MKIRITADHGGFELKEKLSESLCSAGHKLVLDLVYIFLSAQFSGAERHKRRLCKISLLEKAEVHSSYTFLEKNITSTVKAINQKANQLLIESDFVFLLINSSWTQRRFRPPQKKTTSKDPTETPKTRPKDNKT